MSDETMQTRENGELGAALIMALLTLALLLALTMGMSLTAISELGVSSTYGTQTIALEAAEAGLNHAASLVSNYSGSDFTTLLALRPSPLSTDYMTGNNPFVTANVANFAPGCAMIDPENLTRGYQLRDAVAGAVVPDVYYRVSLIDDEPTTSTAGVKVPNFSPAAYSETTGLNANNAAIDKNNRLVIYSTGTYANASVTLEGWIAFLPFPALSANNDIQIGGNTTISGAYGGVHSNSDLIAGNGGGDNWHVEQTATASGQALGTFTGHVDGFYGGGQARLDLPPFVTTDPLTPGGPNTNPRLQDFLIRKADTILIDPQFADGAHGTDPAGLANPATRQLGSLAARLNVSYSSLVTALDQDNNNANNVQQVDAVAMTIARAADGSGTATKVTVASTGWSYNNASNPWNISGPATDNNPHTVYAVGRNNYDLNNPGASTPNGGNVKLTGNLGAAGAPVRVTIFSTGSIDIEGNPNMTANLTGLQTPLLPPFVQIDALLFAVEDVRVRGDFNAAISFTGITYAGEAVDLSGNGSINGQVIAFGNQNVSTSLVEGPNSDPNLNTITGSFELTLNNGNSIGRIRLFSWRQIKR
ncbi:MAG: hypothetical protein WAV20_21455 [Blastocatellia bacterium]